MGTELLRAGGGEQECRELWNLTHPERVQAIHQAYVNAGARVLLTNSFQLNPEALDRHGLRPRLAEMERAAVALARSAAGQERFVLGDVGPIGGEPDANPDTVTEIVRSLEGVDGLLLETYSSPAALDLARALGESTSIPVLLSLTYERDGSARPVSRGGQSPEWYAERARGSHVAALGVNCGRDMDMEAIGEVIRRYRRVCDLPLFTRPNAGTPSRMAEGWIYPESPERLASRLPELLEAGAIMIGGCCGTTPEHIAAFRRVIDSRQARRRRLPG